MATSISSIFAKMTPMLIFSCFCLLTGDMLFGYDTASFGGILANPGFVNQFGSYNPATHKYAFTSIHTSMLSSMPFIGKFIGCLAAGPAIERVGHRLVFFGLAVVSVIGVIIEITASGSSNGSGRYAQFLIGRIIVYISIGLVEVTVTTYQSEIVPAPMRGFVVVSLQWFLNAGAIVANGVNKAMSTSTGPSGWRTVTGVQFIFPALIALFTIFIPDSPRWLLSKDREDDAVASLRRLRPKADIDAGACEEEVQAIKEALKEQVHKAPWMDLVRGKNLRRTTIVMVTYFFQQVTGQAFVSTYQTTFLKTNGFAAEAFTYPLINSCLSFVAVVPGMIMTDRFGRRFDLLFSFFFQAVWMFCLAGVGEKSVRSTTENNFLVAALMLYNLFYNIGGASVPYVVGSEIPNSALREKTQAVGTSWNVVWAFVTNFVIPYIINNIHFQVGWVFGSLACLAFVYTFMFLPETKGLALEEIDAIFDVPYSPFRKTRVHYNAAAMRVGRLEGEAEHDQDEERSNNDGKSEAVVRS
ncbi:Sugar/inositol transporter [Niveomyces insectorum RCEF 264]|uniref:Sugar/inositol transporter n=1 Tax=Niveomyces insectorum RCEF 264 TaxID=1081102 RepID=A0A167UW89_9HYPO|nr:Sugar/inositol transporter [Niveomyces insectorum RCEF 264]